MKTTLGIIGAVWAAGLAAALPEAPSLEAAIPVAQAQHRTILLDFTGKEWCPPCIYLRTKIFDSPEFDRLTKDGYLLVEVVFPRLPEAVAAMPKEQLDANEALLASYNITGGFPTVVVHDENGKPFGVIASPRQTVQEYVAELDKVQQLRAARDAAFTKAQGLQGLERAKALAEGLEAIPKLCRYKYPDVVQEINTLDPQNTLGYARFIANQDELKQQGKDLEGILTSFTGKFDPQDIAAMQAQLTQFLDRKELYPEMRQAALRAMGDSYSFIRGDYNALLKMVEYYRQAEAAAPDTKLAERLRSNLKYYDEQLLPAMKKEMEAQQNKKQ